LLLAKKTITGFGQGAPDRFSSFLVSDSFKGDISPEPVGKWKRPAAFCGAFPLFHRLEVHGFIPTNFAEEPIFQSTSKPRQRNS
jgi:hypothetical protein